MINFKFLTPEDFLKSYSTDAPKKEKIEEFGKEIQDFLKRGLTQSDEEFQKNEINKFIARVYGYDCNTKGNIDSAIYVEDEAHVLIEAKALKNKAEFPKSPKEPQSKALYESILYFLRELNQGNNSIKHIILCNLYEFFLFDAKKFKIFADDKHIKKLYKNCDEKKGLNTTTDKFYQDLESYLASDFQGELPYTYFSFDANLATQELPSIYQLLSPQVLLRQTKTLDANTLNKGFYEELLYILGLEEVSEKSGGKILIRPSDTPNTLSHAISKAYEIDEEGIFTLITTWNNRILFLRLLESMLLGFKHISKPFLDISIIKDFKTLQTLFFEVLAKKPQERKDIKEAFQKIPYLNSSLFDRIALEMQGKEIGLLDSLPLPLFGRSILKKELKDTHSLPLLEYLFRFLHAYDFTTTAKDITGGVKTNHDKLINSAVLGLVFEKLNGYKEGSFYTPSFITSYMCKESITQATLEKFNSTYAWQCQNLESLKTQIEKNTQISDEELLSTLLSIRICDPSVGSGHFLVSALNEMIFIAYTLRIFTLPRGCSLEVENDEILIHMREGVFAYTRPSHQDEDEHIIQTKIFNLKKSIIENCLFGVDINPNSCEITKLRLWIELLKYSFYLFDEKGKPTDALETLPNIDINIKCGNSLISRFGLDDNLNKIKNIKKKIQEYKDLVAQYKDPDLLYPQDKTQLTNKILELKSLFSLTLKDSKTKAELEKAIKRHIDLYNDFALDDESLPEGLSIGAKNLFGTPELSPEEQEEAFASYGRIRALRKKLDSALSGEEYKDAFEWRFEFPEVLDEEGNFLGFDCVIGNPPYIKENDHKEVFANTKHLRTYQGKMDLWYHFAGRGLDILREDGELSFIATNNWTTNAGAKNLRGVICKETQIVKLVDFGSFMVFDSASIQTMVMRFKKVKPPKHYTFKLSKIKAQKPTYDDALALLRDTESQNNENFDVDFVPEEYISQTFNFNKSEYDGLLLKIKKNGGFYLDEKEVAQGIIYPQENVNKKSLAILGKDFYLNQGIQKLSNLEMQALNLIGNEKKLLKPIYENDSVDKYLVKETIAIGLFIQTHPLKTPNLWINIQI